MGRYLGSVCRLCRREGVKLFLKGDRCFTPKCAIERRAYAPGQHGQLRKKLSPYAIRLREKQKLRRIYGLMERQFANVFNRAERMKGMTGENLLSLLERRLDNVVFRMGFASSRSQARQLVNHGHFQVNGRTVNVASYLARPGDRVVLRESVHQSAPILANLEAAKGKRIPSWVQVDFERMEGEIVSVPRREEIEVAIQEQLVVEFYSR